MKFPLTWPQVTTLAGAVIAILIAVLDTWAFGRKFGPNVDLALLWAGIGALLGNIPSAVSTVQAVRQPPT